MRLTAMICGLLMAAVAVAATAPKTLGFSRPTAFSDGSALTTAQITGYEFECVSFDPTGSAPSGACSIPLQTLPGGTYQGGLVTLTNVPNEGGSGCFTLRTLAAGQRSNATSPECASFAATLPNPPSNVTIAVVIGVNVSPAYGYNAMTPPQRIAEPMGFIAVGKPCTGQCLFNFRGECYRKVARSDVQWWIAARDRIAAACRGGSVVAV